MRADDHQLMQPIYISTFTKAGGKDVKYDLEETGFGWKTDFRVEAKDTVMPTTCEQMLSPDPYPQAESGVWSARRRPAASICWYAQNITAAPTTISISSSLSDTALRTVSFASLCRGKGKRSTNLRLLRERNR